MSKDSAKASGAVKAVKATRGVRQADTEGHVKARGTSVKGSRARGPKLREADTQGHIKAR